VRRGITPVIRVCGGSSGSVSVVGRGQVQPRCRQQLSRLIDSEPELIRADLGQLTLQPQPVQLRLRIAMVYPLYVWASRGPGDAT
jgi:hypothetical protein